MLVNVQSSRDRSRQTFAPWSRFQPLRVLHKVAINLGRRLNSISPQPPTALSDRLHSSDCAIDTLVNALKSATILCQVIPQLYSYASLASPYQFLWAFSASAFYLSGPLHVAALRQRFSNKRAYSKSKLLIRSIPQPCLLHYDPFSYLGPPVRKKSYVLRRALSSLLVFVVMFHPRLFVVLHLHFSHVVRANLASTMTCIQT